MASWCFTLNNYGDVRPTFDEEKHEYLVYGFEEAPTTGTPHLQGYIRLKKRQRLASLARWLPRASFTLCRGTEGENRIYCTKSGNFVEHGVFVAERNQQGRRSDLEAIRERIKRGETMATIADGYFGDFVRYHSGFARAIDLIGPRAAIQREMKTFFLWGETNLGKTHRIMTGYPEAYKIVGFPRNPWDNYAGQSILFLDEFTDQWPVTEINGILDKWAYTIQARYRNYQAAWTTVFIASNYDLLQLYPNEPPQLRAAFRRRITATIEIVSREQELPI